VEGHRYRNKMFYKHYDNKPEIESTMSGWNNEHMYKMVKKLRVTYGKKMKDDKNRDRSTRPIPGIQFM
jgi:hypothetical protein